ncbi:hypothetical protein GQ607_011338 [Colletotrichum asianum]|uniref:Uncharacterized protein n=1 Tax=Colletotrichum asianum TaxID=702518 RepID=A0A8H3W8B9_9PEZI|nr:hypothetical protein GQ607_011338 [Colletotrichum asianum]
MHAAASGPSLPPRSPILPSIPLFWHSTAGHWKKETRARLPRSRPHLGITDLFSDNLHPSLLATYLPGPCQSLRLSPRGLKLDWMHLGNMVGDWQVPHDASKGGKGWIDGWGPM